MRMKGLIVLFAATVLAVAVAFFVGRVGPRPVQGSGHGGPVLAEIAEKPASVARIALVRGETKTTLLRHGMQWVVDEKGGYPADQAKVAKLLAGLARLTYATPKTRNPDLYSRLELDGADKKGAKATLVTLADDGGTLLGELIVGKPHPDDLGGGDDGVYVRRPGNPQCWLAHGTADVGGDTASWLDRKLVDLPEAQVKSLVLTEADGGKLTIGRDKQDAPLSLAELPPGGKLKSETALDDRAGALANLDLVDAQPAKTAELPKDGVVHAEFTSFDGLTVAIDAVAKGDATWARLTARGSGAAATKATELNARWADWAFELPSYQAGLLKTKLADLLEPPKGS
jgi:hypothetical protein